MIDMKNIFRFIAAAAAAMAAAAGVQSCDVVDGYLRGSEAVSWSDESTVVVSSAGATVNFSFTARDDWRVESEAPSMLTVTSASSGLRGRSSIRVAVAKNNSDDERRGTITIYVNGFEPETLLTVVQRDTASADYEVNMQRIDPYLSEMYLWNDEYNALARDLDQPYDDFVTNTLLGMRTNSEDGPLDKNGNRTKLFSYITRTPSGSSRSVTAKTPRPTFGVMNVTVVSLLDERNQPIDNKLLCLHGVYPGSPAANRGLTRGSCIISVDGAAVTTANYGTILNRLITAPTAGDTMTVVFAPDFYDYYDGITRSVKITAENMPCNPVLHSELFERGGAKIGYLVYGDFESSFDDELLAAIGKLRSEGIDELVLDLRINGGGEVISMQMLSSIIAGQKSDGKVCLKQQYNDTRMKQLGYTFPDKMDSFAFGPDAKPSGTMSQYSKSDYLTLQRLYVLVGSSTASASEVLISSLRGIDFPVTLIGARTTGKNVGMEPDLFTYGGYDYSFYPITFRCYNAKNETFDHRGIKPDYEINEWEAGGNALWAWGSEYDPLLKQAVDLIRGSRAAADGGAADSRAAASGRELMPHRAEVLYESPRPCRGVIDNTRLR